MPQDTTNSAAVPQEMTVARWLFNPFIRIAGGQALAIGLTVIVVSGLVASVAGVHFDGVLDFHPGYRVAYWVPIVEGLVNWAVIAGLLVLVSILVGRRTVRPIDIAGTQAMARFPLLLATLACVPPSVRREHEELVSALAQGRLMLPQGWEFVVVGLVTTVCSIWMVWLMWKGFSVSCNQHGGRAVAIFAAVVVAAEAASKLVLTQILRGVAVGGLTGAVAVAGFSVNAVAAPDPAATATPTEGQAEEDVTAAQEAVERVACLFPRIGPARVWKPRRVVTAAHATLPAPEPASRRLSVPGRLHRFLQIAQRQDRAMNRHELIDPEAAVADGLEQHCRGFRKRASDPRDEHVGLNQHPLGRQIDEEHAIGVGIVPHPEDLHDSTAFLQLECVVTGHRLQHQLRRLLSQMIGHDGVRPGRELLEQALVRLMSDHRQPFRHRRPNAARVIEVMMSVDGVAQRLVRHELARPLDGGQRSRVVLRRLHQNGVLGELDQHAVMGLPGEKPDAVGDLLIRHVGGGQTRLRG